MPKLDQKPRLTSLTDDENRAWCDAFAYYIDEAKMPDDEADKLAWKDAQDKFPRLRAFDGCKP